jgi:type I restriction enzyme S subunit
MIRYRQGVVYGQWRIHESDFLKIEEEIPSLEEQQKIADFLASLDKAIDAKQQQITLAENWKKGLMQGLFI